MILPESRNLEWIEKAAKDNNASNPILVEKVIRAFSLLEALARSGCPFIFKGGSSLMLHFGSSRRLSIDVDIICPPASGPGPRAASACPAAGEKCSATATLTSATPLPRP